MTRSGNQLNYETKTIMTDVESKAEKKARMIKASTLLQAKVGLGPLDEKVLNRCQDVMDNNKVDFAPLAREYLATLGDVIDQARAGELNRDRAMHAITEPVMQLKAHASMFRYTLVGDLANIMMSFLESITEIDSNVIDIVDAHHKTLKTIISKKLEGDGGRSGETLKSELNDAIRRYSAKKR
jgi:hypothetical protein